ncbi:MAG: DUF1819 family protein [Spirochaetes bacterium]|nr:DUF1819 family protein [Spirochaetota bacterium]
MDENKYKLSFTFGGLLLPETKIIAGEYLKTSNWDEVRIKALEENILQKTRKSSRYRYFREIRDRLNNAYAWELEILGNEIDQNIYSLVNLTVVSRYYRFVRDFIIEVIRYKTEGNDFTLTDYDYEAFLEAKSQYHPEILDLSESTRNKIRQVVIRMLKETGILTVRGREKIITKPFIPDVLAKRYAEAGTAENMMILLLPDREIGILRGKYGK